MTGAAAAEDELLALERVLGFPLPAPYRFFLRRLGGGVFYLEHELFGPRRVMVHDIELVPDLLSFRAWLGAELPPAVLPIHRMDGRIHVLDLQTGACRRLDATAGARDDYADFTAFLETVVLP
jgi:hypothetical protein